MSLFRSLLPLIIFTFSTSWAVAEDELYNLNADSYFLRSSPRFGANQNNVVGVLTRNSTFRIIERQARADGSQAMRIEVVDLAADGSQRPSENYWIYFSEERRTDYAMAPGSVNRGVLSDTAAAPCDNCSPPLSPPIPPATQDDLAAVVRTTTADFETQESEEIVVTANALNRQVSRYSNSAAVDAAIQSARDVIEARVQRARHRYRNRSEETRLAAEDDARGSTGYCYRGVKNALVASGLLDSYLNARFARTAVRDLKRRGFVNLLEEPYSSHFNIRRASDAPRGAILVYSSNRNSAGRGQRHSRGYGHVEIKIGGPGEPGYISDFESETPITDAEPVENPSRRVRYNLIGVMVKLEISQ